MEKIFELTPDLIIISGRQADYYEELNKIAPTIHLGVNNENYLESFEVNMKTLGQIFGEEKVVEKELNAITEAVENLNKKVAERKEADAETGLQTQLIEAMLEGFEAEIPAAMIETKVMENIRDFDYSLQMQGLNMQQYMQYMGLTLDSIKEQYKEQSEKQVKMRLAFEKIAELESLEPTEEEIEGQYKEYAEMYSMDVDKIKASIPQEELVKDLKVKKASDFIKDNAKITEVKA